VVILELSSNDTFSPSTELLEQKLEARSRTRRYWSFSATLGYKAPSHDLARCGINGIMTSQLPVAHWRLATATLRPVPNALAA